MPEVETVRVRNGFVCELDDSDLGSVSRAGAGLGSSKGDTTAVTMGVSHGGKKTG